MFDNRSSGETKCLTHALSCCGQHKYEQTNDNFSILDDSFIYLDLYLISFTAEKQINIFNTDTQDESLVVSFFGLRNLLSTTWIVTWSDIQVHNTSEKLKLEFARTVMQPYTMIKLDIRSVHLVTSASSDSYVLSYDIHIFAWPYVAFMSLP